MVYRLCLPPNTLIIYLYVNLYIWTCIVIHCRKSWFNTFILQSRINLMCVTTIYASHVLHKMNTCTSHHRYSILSKGIGNGDSRTNTSTQKQPNCKKKVQPMQKKAAWKKLWNQRWLPRSGCGGLIMAKIIITFQANLCCLLQLGIGTKIHLKCCY